MKNNTKHMPPKQAVFDSNLTKQHFSNKIFKVYLKCIQHYYPEISVEGICERAGLSNEYIMDETKWASAIFDQKFTAECIKTTNDPQLPYKSGLTSLTPEGIGNFYFYLAKYTLSTTQIFRTISSQALNFSKVMSMEIVSHGKEFLHLRYRPINVDTLNDDEQKALFQNLENIYQNTIGYIESVPTIHGQQKAEVKHYTESGQNDVQELHMQVTYIDTKPVRMMTGWLSAIALLLAGFGYVWASQPKEIVLSELTIKLLMTGSLSILFFFVFLLINYFRQKMITGESKKIFNKLDLQYRELQKTKETLRDNEKFLRKVAENYPDSYVAVIEKDFTVSFISGLEFKKQSINPDKFLGLSSIEIFPDHADSVQQYLKNTFKGEECSFEFLINNQNLLYNTVPLHSEDGSILRILVVIKNITTLRESEERYRLIAENMADNVATMDMNLRFTYISPSIKQFRGFSDEEAMKQTIDQVLTPDSLQNISRVFDEELIREETGTANPDRFRILEVEQYKKDGSTIWVENRFSFIRDEGKKPIGIIIASRDITERKQSEKALRESEERFKTLHNASFGGIAIHDKGLILDCNQGLSEITGYSETELIGMDGLLLIAEKSKKTVMNNILSGYEKPYEAIGLHKNGKEFPMRIEARAMPYKGKTVRTVEFRDITEQNQAEKEREKLQAQLIQAQKMESVGRLAGGVAHDYNNALSVIIGFTELAIDEVDPNGIVRENLDEVFSAAKRAADITRQLLAFARKQTIAPKVLDLNENVESMLKMLRRLIGEDIDLAWLPKAGLWPVKVDPSQIDQILANLSVNARDAIQDVGRISIETENSILDEIYCAEHTGFVPGEFVLLSVSDNGCGMGKDILDNIFEPFFTTKDVDKGTGLGLATVYGIIKQNNGFINVYSEPGQGTTVEIYLPRHVGKVENLEETSAVIPSGHGETILLVEDDLSILKLARNILEGLDYIVLTAGTPGEAIGLAEERAGKVDLLVTDVIMPEMNGRELSERMQQLYPNLRHMFMSGYTADAIAHHGVLNEGVHFIQKPFSRIDLAKNVRKALDD